MSKSNGNGKPSRGPLTSLRDFFAGKVIPALLADYLEAGQDLHTHATTMSREAYVIADAMLKAREEK